MNSLILSIAALLVLALSALFAVPFVVDWNSYRDVFEAQTSKMIGRAVEVGGDVQLTLLPTPVLRFEKVRVANAAGDFATPFAEARSFTMWLAVPPLLRGRVQARRVELERPVLNLKIDDDGSGNWRDLGRADPSAAFAPREITLDSVRIADATITLSNASGGAPLVFEDLDGELSARSLHGPYKFAGKLQFRGEAHELRFSTGRRERDGSVHLKALARDLSGRRSYVLAGALFEAATEPRFEGRVSMRFGEGGSDPDKASNSQSPPADALVQIKSELKAGLTHAVLEEAEITLRRKGRPQTIAGRFSADWRDGLVLDGRIKGRWFDIDSLMARGNGPRPVSEAVPALAAWALAQSGRVRSARLRVSIGQAVFAGDLVKDLELDVAASDRRLKLDRLSGRVPGDNTITLAGEVRPESGGSAFVGRGRLEGRRLGSFVRWAGLPVESLGPADETGDFSIEVDLAADGQRIAVEKARGHLLGTAFTGALRYRTGARREFVLQLDSDRIDVTKLVGPSASLSDVLALLPGGVGRKTSEGTAPAPGGWLANAEARLDLRVGTIVLPGFGRGSMTAKLRLVDGVLDIRKFDLSAASGAKLQAEGRLAGLSRAPDGKLTLLVRAAKPGGLKAVAAFLGLPARTAQARLELLAPLNMVATLESRDQASRELKFNFAGTAGGGDVGLSGSYRGELTVPSQARIALRGTIGNGNGKALLRQIFPELGAAELERFPEGKGVLSLVAAGVASSALKGKFALDAAGLRATFNGDAAWTDSGFTLSGRAALKAHDIAGVLALVDMDLSPGHAGAALDVRGTLVKTADQYRIDDLSGDIGEQSVTGNVRVTLAGPRPRIEAEVSVGEVALSRLLAPTLAWSKGPASDLSPVRGVTVPQSYWPDRRFNLALLSGFDGRLSVNASQLQLAEAIVVKKATLDVRLDAGKLTVPVLEGGLYGGRFKATARFAKRGGGMAFLATAQGEGLRLEQATRTQGGESLASGPLDLEMSVAGEGLTPRALASGLTGEGRLKFGAGKIHRLSPVVLKRFRDPSRPDGTRPEPAASEGLRDVVVARLKRSEFSFAPLSAAFALRSGTARFEKVTLGGADGHATVSSYLDVASLRFESEWLLTLPAGTADATVPRITVVFAGSLREFGRIEPEVDTQALRRYITMRLMEQDVQRLEALDIQGRNPPGTTAATRKTDEVKTTAKSRREPPQRPGAAPKPPPPPEQPIGGAARKRTATTRPEAPPRDRSSTTGSGPVTSRPLPPVGTLRPPPPVVRAQPLPPVVTSRPLAPVGTPRLKPPAAAPRLPSGPNATLPAPAGAPPGVQTGLREPGPVDGETPPEAADAERPPAPRRKKPPGARAFEEFSD